MPSIWDELTNDGPEFLDTFGRDAVFRTLPIKVLVSRAMEVQNLENGGFTYGGAYQVRFFAPAGTPMFTNHPNQGERVRLWGKDYTITGVTHRPPDPWIDVTLVNADAV
jgi:hypothetical protein